MAHCIGKKKFSPGIVQKNQKKINEPDNWSNLFYLIGDYGLIALAVILVNLRRL